MPLPSDVSIELTHSHKANGIQKTSLQQVVCKTVPRNKSDFLTNTCIPAYMCTHIFPVVATSQVYINFSSLLSGTVCNYKVHRFLKIKANLSII